jgi:hypothetical protein
MGFCRNLPPNCSRPLKSSEQITCDLFNLLESSSRQGLAIPAIAGGPLWVVSGPGCVVGVSQPQPGAHEHTIIAEKRSVVTYGKLTFIVRI